jgi:hypothetical protein
MKRILTRRFETKEAFHVKGSGKAKPGHHSNHHDHAVTNTPGAPAEPVGPEGKCQQKCEMFIATFQITWFREKS